MKIGIYGGTFNPFHLGHLAIAESAKKIGHLDEVWFIPAGNPYMKDQSELLDGRTRYEMIIDTLNDFDINWGKVSTFEITNTTPSYTWNTMQKISKNSSHEFYLIMGYDAYLSMNQWYNGEQLKLKYPLIVFNRNTYLKETLSLRDVKDFSILNTNIISNISSTDIRKAIKANENFQSMVSPSVYKRIMNESLYKITNKYDAYMHNFDAAQHAEYLIDWIRTKMNNRFGPDSKCVIGISGGKDSTVMAGLCVKALGPKRVYGVLLPDGIQTDIKDSYKIIDHLGIEYFSININNAKQYLLEETAIAMHTGISKDAKINLPARLRMSTLYLVAQTLGNAFVVNTCNLSEDWVGYSTWHGDSAGDFSPFAKYTTDEIIAMGDYLELPYELVHKTPNDGLCGQTDEDKLGFTYRTLNAYIRCNICPDNETKRKINNLHKKNEFKLKPLDYPPFLEA